MPPSGGISFRKKIITAGKMPLSGLCLIIYFADVNSVKYETVTPILLIFHAAAQLQQAP